MRLFKPGIETQVRPLLKDLLAALVYDITFSCAAYLETRQDNRHLDFEQELVGAVLDEITLGLYSFYDFTDVGLLIVDEQQKCYRSVTRRGPFLEPLKPGVYRQHFGVGLIGRCHRLAQTVIVGDTGRERDMLHIPGVPILSELLVPIKYGQPAQVLAIFDIGDVKKNAFEAPQQIMVETVAECLAPLLANPAEYMKLPEPTLRITSLEWEALIRTLSFTNTYLTASRRLNALQISTATGELAETIEAQALKAQEQARVVQETTLTAESVGRSAQQIAMEAHQLSQLGEVTASQMATSQKELNQSLKSIEQLAESANQNALAGESLLQRLAEVQRVGALLEEIGEETNLLALNATIEARGAGPGGQRFGVVASEVRELAERVKLETRYIRNLLREVEDDGEEVRQRSTEIADKITSLAEQLEFAGNALTQALQLVQKTEAGIRIVERLTRKQEEAGQSIAEAMREAQQAVDVMAREEARLADSINQLKEIAARLGGLQSA